jgi:hypothetical protein
MIRFTVRLKGPEIQPVQAESYIVDGETLVFFRPGGEIAALFDMSVVVDWEPKLENPSGERHA